MTKMTTTPDLPPDIAELAARAAALPEPKRAQTLAAWSVALKYAERPPRPPRPRREPTRVGTWFHVVP